MSAKNELLRIINLTNGSINNWQYAFRLFLEQTEEIYPAEEYRKMRVALMNRPSAAIRCERMTYEIGNIVVKVSESYIRARELSFEWFELTQRLLAIYLIILGKSPVETSENQRAHLRNKCDVGFKKWVDQQNEIKKRFTGLVIHVEKLAATSPYISEPFKSTVLNSSAAAAVIGRRLPKLSKVFAELKSSLDDFQVRIHIDNKDVDAENTDDTEAFIPHGYGAALDFIMDISNKMLKALYET